MINLPDDFKLAISPDRAQPVGPLDGYESLALDDLPRLQSLAEEWRDQLEAEGIDVLALIQACESIRQRAESWINR